MSASGVVLVGALCVLESLQDGVRAHACDGTPSWTIPAPGAATVVKGAPGGMFEGATVDVQLNDSESSWLGLSERTPRGVRPRGLVRHDWKRGVTHAFRGADAGPCGFEVNDLMLRDDTLWVATDLGVSRLRLSHDDWDEWTHFALASDGTSLEETACASMLAGVAEAAAAPGGEELGRWLAEFRPRFAKRLRPGIKSAKRGTRPASPTKRRRNEQALGNARRARPGRWADVHPRPIHRPQGPQDRGGEGEVDEEDVRVGHRTGVP